LSLLHKLLRALMQLIARCKPIHCNCGFDTMPNHIFLDGKNTLACGANSHPSIFANLQPTSAIGAFISPKRHTLPLQILFRAVSTDNGVKMLIYSLSRPSSVPSQ